MYVKNEVLYNGLKEVDKTACNGRLGRFWARLRPPEKRHKKHGLSSCKFT